MGGGRILRQSARAWLAISLCLWTGACAGGAGQTGGASQASALQQAKNSYFQRDLATARQRFNKALAQTSLADEERAEAARGLAKIAWRFDQDWEQAHSYLDKAEDLDGGSFETALERARILRRQRELDRALAAARQALARAETKEDRIGALTSLGRAVLLRSEKGLGQGLDAHARRETVQGALGRILQGLRENRGHLKMSRVALGLALLADDGPSALEAWRSYYWVPPSLNATATGEGAGVGWDYPLLSEAHSRLSRRLPQWAGPASPANARAEVIEALASSGFFAEAAWLAADPRVSPHKHVDSRPRVSEIVAYNRFLERVKNATREYYRRRALGEGANRELRDGLMAAARPLWKSLHSEAAAPRLGYQRLVEEIADRFGAYVYFQTHGSIRSLNMGHRIVDRQRLVEQYGRSAEVRLVVLDSMVSNGYNTWFWDGAASAGGWVDESGAIVQVRPSYAGGPLRAWNRLTDPEERRKIEKRIQEKSKEDDAIARANPFAYLPGLALRMRRQAQERILAELRSRGLKGAELKSAFINELTRRTRASSIFAHEGRHALDFRDTLRNYLRSSAEKEFRAKLSEVALAPDPRIALTGGILAANIGDGSSHGQANQRIMKGLVRWMKEHRPQIQGLDESRPFLPQLDRLTDAQLREAFRSMDPWAE